MNRSLQLGIPTPCHETWDNMQPTGKGRHCASCQKTVVDFTAMSDEEIIRYMSKAGPHVCGRLSPDQINRPLIPLTPPQQNRLPGWPLVVAGLLFTSDESTHYHPLKGEIVYETPKPAIQEDVTVEIIIPRTIQKEVPPKDTIKETPTQILGTPSLVILDDLVPMADISIHNAILPFNDTIPPPPSSIAPLPSPPLQGMLGGIVCIRPKKIDTLKKLITDTLSALNPFPQKQTPIQPADKTTTSSNLTLVVYPNPVRRGTTFHLSWQTEPGKYQVSLFTSTGTLVREQWLQLSSMPQTTDWNIPANMPAGIYIIRAVRPGQPGVYARELMVE